MSLMQPLTQTDLESLAATGETIKYDLRRPDSPCQYGPAGETLIASGMVIQVGSIIPGVNIIQGHSVPTWRIEMRRVS